jgi:UDP:flavonoid glycosyltransferase YjiC (YdhE family)
LRILITTTGYAGHFLPLVPFARACVRAGHEVRVAAPRSRAAIIERAGLEFQACADPAEDDLARIVATVSKLSQRDGHARMMSEGFASIAARAILADLLEIAGSWRPEVIVRECQEYAGALAAERHGIPHVRVALGQTAQEEETLSVAAGPVEALRAELGLPADPHAETLRESPYLTLMPPALEQPGTSAPRVTHRFRPNRDGSQPLQGPWPDGGEPIVYLTFGSVAGLLGLYPRVYRAAIEPLAGLAARVLVTIGEDADPADVGPLPQNVHVERWVAQEAILPHAAAVVCHGGYGSVLGALAHGVPLVALPIFSDDQWRNAARVAEVGAGVALDGHRGAGRRMLDGPNQEAFFALPGAIEAVLSDPRYRQAARGISQAMEALPPVDSAVGVLEAIAGS